LAFQERLGRPRKVAAEDGVELRVYLAECARDVDRLARDTWKLSLDLSKPKLSISKDPDSVLGKQELKAVRLIDHALAHVLLEREKLEGALHRWALYAHDWKRVGLDRHIIERVRGVGLPLTQD
jgi:transposase